MHHYQFNIGDYRRRTGHLTLVEHAIYRALIDTYFLNESPLCADVAKLMRTHGARTEEEQAAFRHVLEDFFELTEDGYRHESCDGVLSKIYKKSDKAKKSAEARWAKQNAKKMQKGCERIPDAQKQDANASKSNANDMLPINPITHNPITHNNSQSSPPPEDPIDREVAEHIFAGVRRLNAEAKEPNWSTWVKACRLMRERDSRSPEQAKKLFTWANNDHFWQGNILSPDKLRKHFDRLVIQSSKINGSSTTSNKPTLSNTDWYTYDEQSSEGGSNSDKQPVFQIGADIPIHEDDGSGGL